VIRNEREFNKAVASIEQFDAQLAAAREKYGGNPGMLELMTRQLDRHLQELRQDLAEYSSAKAGNISAIFPAFNPRSRKLEVGRALNRIRLAKGISQEDLAQRVGTHQPSIARWEDPAYEAYRLVELRRVASELGFDLDVVFISRAASEPIPGHLTLEGIVTETLARTPALNEVLTTKARDELVEALKDAFRMAVEQAVVARLHQEEPQHA
jgi:transcriptional regulator with XRE-family HTH domain